MVQHTDRGVRFPQRSQALGGPVGAAVVDIDQLERTQRIGRPQDFFGYRRDVVRLVEDRDQNRKPGFDGQCWRGCDRICSR